MPENRQAEALAITCVFPIIAALFVAARTLSRYLGQNFGWDDWLIGLALVLLLGQTITIYECEQDRPRRNFRVANTVHRHPVIAHRLSFSGCTEAERRTASSRLEMELCSSDVLPPDDGGDTRIDYYVPLPRKRSTSAHSYGSACCL